MIKNKLSRKLLEDLSALGALPFYLFLSVLFFVIGEKKLSLILLLSLAAMYILVVPIRYFYHKPRPEKEEYKNAIEKIDASSFPSIHSWRTALLFSLTGFYYNNTSVLILFLSLLAIVTSTRILLKKHYLTDVLSGIVFGAIESYIVFYVFAI